MQHLIEQYGLLVVFVNAFCDQIGLPVPAYLSFLVTGAMVEDGHFGFTGLLVTAVAGALIADMFWFYTGKRYGTRVMAKLCKLSLSPDSCVKQTETFYLKLGPSSLLFCKFIPGFASISSALAGSLKTKTLTFVLFDSFGAVLWVGSGLGLGYLFSPAIDKLLVLLMELGKWGGLIIALAFALFISKKWWERHQFLQSLKMARISVEDLYTLIEQGRNPVIVDTRAPQFLEDGWIPGAIFIDTNNMGTLIDRVHPNEQIILYCSCPNEATAATIAKSLRELGYLNVRPLAGGIDAWNAAGYRIAGRNN